MSVSTKHYCVKYKVICKNLSGCILLKEVLDIVKSCYISTCSVGATGMIALHTLIVNQFNYIMPASQFRWH